MNIFQKMLSISEEVGTVAKNLSVGWGSNQYKAVSEADVLAAIKPLETKYGIYSYPLGRRVIESGTLTNVVKGDEKRSLFLRVETTYRFVNAENPDEYIDITSYGDGVDSQDKAPGKAMTYADKYALLKAYKIQTGDDPDQEASAPLRDRKNKPMTATVHISKEQASGLIERLKNLTPPGNPDKVCEQYNVKALEDLTLAQYENLDSRLRKSGV